MAVKLSDFGATVTTGRGAAKTVILEVDFKALERWARRMKIDEARVWRKAYGSAIRSLRSKLQKVVSRAGGVEGVPKFRDFEEFTRQLRAANNRTKPMGGVLAEKGRIVAYKQNDYQIIGWPDALAKWAVKFQEADTHPFTDAQRHWMERRGVKDIPTTYSRPDRDVINSFSANLAREWPDMVRAMFEKYYSARIRKYGEVK